MGRHDQEILDLCRAGDQQAIAAMEEAYGSYCYKVALNILGDHHDAEECVSDAYLAVWNAIPAAEPGNLLAYLAKTTRNIALKRLAYHHAQKRDSGIVLVLDELAEVLPARGTAEDAVAEGLLMQAVNDFLRYKASKVERNLFLRRYFWGDSIADLRKRFGYSESKTKSILHRTRTKLRAYLETRGVLEP